MHLIADLHTHSKYSRATSRDLDLEHLALWARRKGTHIVGTGDVTHPDWLQELQEKLIPAEEGLFQLRPELDQRLSKECPSSISSQLVRFLLAVEVCTIFKRGNTNHRLNHLVCLPGWSEASVLQQIFASEGNLSADGRPILGMDARDLLAQLLDISPRVHLIPTQIWSPHASLLGARSGFGSVVECFGDLASSLFALEMGSASDVRMNQRLSSLDHYTLLSHSNAHTPSRVGQEANWLNCALSYDEIFASIRSGAPESWLGTFGGYPEAGRYYYDGHRSCKVRLHPSETKAFDGRCPVCKKPLTTGVLNRIEALADRTEEALATAPSRPPSIRMVTLETVLSEIFEIGPKSRRIQRQYHALLEQFGSERDILMTLPEEELKRANIPLFTEAIKRVRAGQVEVTPGYDGEQGVIRIFQENESKATSFSLFPGADLNKKEDDVQLMLFPAPKKYPPPRQLFPGPESEHEQLALFVADNDEPRAPLQHNEEGSSPSHLEAHEEEELPTQQLPRTILKAPTNLMQSQQMPQLRLRPPTQSNPVPKQLLFALNTEQRMAVVHWGSPMLISAGPGTGKTRTLAHRIAYLVASTKVSPRHMVVLALTQHAARALEEQLYHLLKGPCGITVATFHQFCLQLLEQEASREQDPTTVPTILGPMEQLTLLRELAEQRGLPLSHKELKEVHGHISQAKQQLLLPDECAHLLLEPESKDASLAPFLQQVHPEFLGLYQDYQSQLRRLHSMDLDDLLVETVLRLQSDVDFRQKLQRSIHSLHVDEYQDLTELPFQLLRLLYTEQTDLCVSGDPDQAMLHTQRPDAWYFRQFLEDFSTPRRKAIRCSLWRNYRSPERLLEAAYELISTQSDPRRIKLLAMVHHPQPITSYVCQTESAEAAFVAQTIQHWIEEGLPSSYPPEREPFAPGQICILVRTPAQQKGLQDALTSAGISYQSALQGGLKGCPGAELFLACLRLALPDQQSWPSWLYLIRRWPGLGAEVEQVIREAHKQQSSIHQALRRLGETHQASHQLMTTLDDLGELLIQPHDTPSRLQACYLRLCLQLDASLLPTPQAMSLLETLAQHTSTPLALLQEWALERHLMVPTQQDAQVTLLPFEAARGLAFPIVWIVGFEEGHFPLPDEPDEQTCRQLYVGMTRTQQQLFISRSQLRNTNDTPRQRQASRFWQRIAPFTHEEAVTVAPPPHLLHQAQQKLFS